MPATGIDRDLGDRQLPAAMTPAKAIRRNTSADVIVYGIYLASFILLLYGSTMLFGQNLLTLAFGGFLVGVIGVVAVVYRSLYS